MNLSFTGNLGNTPELKFSHQGTSYVFFSVAMNTAQKGSKNNQVVWWNCAAFQDLAEDIAMAFKKGDTITVKKSYVGLMPDKRNGTQQLQVKVCEVDKPS